MENREFTADNTYIYNQKGPLQWIISHLFRYKSVPLLVIVIAFVNNYAFSSIRVYVGRAFDVIVSDLFEIPHLLPFVGIIILLAILQGFTGLGRNVLVEFLAQRMERDTRDELYVSLLGKNQSFFGHQNTGDIMARATSDVRALNVMMSPGIMLILDSFSALIIPIVLIGLIHPSLLVVPAFFVFFLILTIWDYNKKLKPITMRQREIFGEMSSTISETMGGIEVVKANMQERYEWNKFIGKATDFREFFIKQGIIQAKYWPMVVFAITRGLAFLHGVYLWKRGVITIGEAIAFIELVGVFRFVTFISLFSFNLVQMGLAGARRILALINTTNTLDENNLGIEKVIQGKIDYQNVFFSYGIKNVLKDITFSISPGMTVAIVGNVGSGKTTLIRLVNRIFDTSQGTVSIDGHSVRDWNLSSLRSQISCIEQDIFLFSRSVRENIAFGNPEIGFDTIVKAAKQAEAHDFIMTLKDTYDTQIGERGVLLSGGEKQRIALARAFLTNPRILVLDDSTSAIDSETEDLIQRAMANVSKNRTTLIITHRLSQIRWADWVIVLKNGAVIGQGKHEHLLETCTSYRNIFPKH